jgi:rhodanese-related sulfurtransferase
MPNEVLRGELRRLVAAGAQLVEVLPAEEYADQHLPDAINMPLETINRESALSKLRVDRPVIVYCQGVE